MKKSLFFILAFLVFAFPIMAQEEIVSEEVPEENLTLKKANIPPAIVNAADKLFEGSTQIAWGTFPYQLKDYGWVVDKDYKGPIDRYEIRLIAKDGSVVNAVFESNGELVSYNLVNKDSPVPDAIIASLEKGQYKGWKVVGDVMRITNNQKKIVDHYAVKIQNGKMKKTVYFTVKGGELINK
jgi:hypothetical protein